MKAPGVKVAVQYNYPAIGIRDAVDDITAFVNFFSINAYRFEKFNLRGFIGAQPPFFSVRAYAFITIPKYDPSFFCGKL